MSDATVTTASAYLKEVYDPVTVLQVMYTKNPFLAMIPKDETFTGIDVKQPVVYANPAGRSATFSTAQSSARGSASKAFTLTRSSDYAVATISRELLKASLSDKGAFLKYTQPEMQGALNAIKRSLAVGLYRSGSGSIGQLSSSSNVTTGPFTLANTKNIKNFEVGMLLSFSTADGGGTEKTGSGYITGIDRGAGTFQISVNGNTYSTAVATSDYVFVAGDYDAKIKGLAAWVPTSAPSATTFFGVDRTADIVRLAGNRLDRSTSTIEEAIIDIDREVCEMGDGAPDTFLCTPTAFSNLSKELGSKVKYGEAAVEKGGVKFSFQTIELNGMRGVVRVIGDYNCPPSLGYMLQLDTWKLRSLGVAPEAVDEDGLMILRGASSDNFEVRYAYYAQLGCHAPGYNGVVQLAA